MLRALYNTAFVESITCIEHYIDLQPSPLGKGDREAVDEVIADLQPSPLGKGDREAVDEVIADLQPSPLGKGDREAVDEVITGPSAFPAHLT